MLACGSDDRTATPVRLATLPQGLFLGLMFDPAGTLTDPRLSFDAEGAAYTSGIGNLYKRPAGSTTWITINPDQKLYSLPMFASDGTAYALGLTDVQTGLAPVYFAPAGSTTSTATGDTFPRLTDAAGNLWTVGDTDASLERLHETMVDHRAAV